MSGVYISGSELPKPGRVLIINSDGSVELSNRIDVAIFRPPTPGGQAIPVPDHGRLGDLDELEKSFREDADDTWNKRARPMNWADAFGDVADIVSGFPTIIPAEEAT